MRLPLCVFLKLRASAEIWLCQFDSSSCPIRVNCCTGLTQCLPCLPDAVYSSPYSTKWRVSKRLNRIATRSDCRLRDAGLLDWHPFGQTAFRRTSRKRPEQRKYQSVFYRILKWKILSYRANSLKIKLHLTKRCDGTGPLNSGE